MNNDRAKWAQVRLKMIYGAFALCFLAAAGRGFYLQVMQHDQLVKLAERQHQRTIKIIPARGAIYDSTGAALAVSLELDSLYAEPKRIKEPTVLAEKLAPHLNISRATLIEKLDSDRGFVWIARQLPPDTAVRIRGLKLPGIGFAKENKRFYPNFEMASHVLGFTGMDPGGLEGLERYYDSTVLGKTGLLLTERDALGRDVARKDPLIQEAVPGKNLHLTLDKNIQYFAEKELAQAVIKSRAKNGMAVVMDPWSGKILALANYPTFNPNSFRQYPNFNLRNRSVSDSFEPGSTFKIFLLAAALEERLVRPQEGINCENGRYSFRGRIIRDDHPQGHISVSDVLKYSSNIGSAKIGLRLGDERLYKYLKDFGFGERSGVDLPGEAVGSLRPISRWYGTDIATISFGQGVSATALQIAAATSAVANGGRLMKPYLVEKITDTNGQLLQQFEPKQIRQVISAQTASSLTRMMEEVTRKGGTATAASIEGFRVAGKTGTAQKVDPISKGYSARKRTASFVGFVPADRPLLTILVVVDEPQTSPYGGVVAAPAFREIAFNSLCYLKAAGGENACKLPVSKEEKPLDPTLLPPATQEDNFVATQPEEQLAAGKEMPDFSGMSMRRVMQVMEKRQINLQLRGSGRVVEQHPQAGQLIRGGDQIWVRLTSTI